MGGETRIFVFGSNLAGRHGRGSAFHAKQWWGAKNGVGVGFCGRSYAIPTKDEKLKVLSLTQIRTYVRDFLEYARQHPDWTFDVVRIGCGLAGYTDEQMAPMFAEAPPNVVLHNNWEKILGRKTDARYEDSDPRAR